MTPPLSRLAPICDRPAGEPSLLAGVSLLVLISLVATLAAAVLP